MDATYKAYSSFAPVYTDAVDYLYEQFGVIDGRKHETILRRVVEHADSFGCTFVGVGRLMAKSGYSEGTVKRSLNVLGDVDYIRVHVEYIKARRKPIITIQVNPRVMWIQATSISEAESVWNSGLKYRNEILNGHPELELESEPESRTRPQNQTQNQTPPPPREAKSTNTDVQSQRVAPKKQQREAQESEDETEPAVMTSQRVAQSQRQNTPPGSAAPPPLVAISRCRKALPDSDQEDYAHWLQATFGTRLQQARQVVLTYGIEAVKLVVRRYDIEKTSTNFHSPFGMILYWLSRGEVLQADIEAYQMLLQEHVSHSLAGQYADLFER